MIEIQVPATSANMGPGFDCLGIALTMYNRYWIEEIEEGIQWEGCEEQYQNMENLLYLAMEKCFKKIGYQPKGLKIKMESDIPISRGLGSSAACIVAGIVAANELGGKKLAEQEMIELATEMEGHPDNVVPAFLGGMTVAIQEKTDVYYDKVNMKEGLKFYALIPNFPLSTKKAREALPKEISYKDGVYNIGRTAMMITALTNGNFDLVRVSCGDKLHQCYRGKLIEGYDKIVKACEDAGSVGVFLSGAGPTIMAMAKGEERDFLPKVKQYIQEFKSTWSIVELMPSLQGIVVKNK